jgi:AbiV family abortive infection protein
LKHKPLDQYDGRLSPAEIAAGMNAARRNGERLLDDARLLMQAGRYASACSLAILSIEESGKGSILRQLAVAKTDAEVNDSWRSYRNHRTKNALWLIGILRDAVKSLEDMRPAFDPTSDHPAVLDAIKQLGFYTDCLGDRRWSAPNEVIDASLASQLIGVADTLRLRQDFSAREIELWIDHVGPHFNTPQARHAVVAWERAMKAEGLSIYTSEEFEAFMLGPSSLASE